MNRQKVASGALKRLNEVRQEAGFTPVDILPRGHRGDASHCVLANALPGGRVFSKGIFVAGVNYRHSRASLKFIKAFDSGRYPEFDIDGSYSDEDRRRLCESPKQTKEREEAAKSDAKVKGLVTELREIEHRATVTQEKLEGAEAREAEANAKLEAEREINKRLEDRLADQHRKHTQQLSELIHEVPSHGPEIEEPERREDGIPIG